MRPDMTKVIVDCGKHGGRPVTRERLQFRNWTLDLLEEYDHCLPVGGKISLRSDKVYRKEQGDRLNPLVRFLRKNIGRNWNDIYSEIIQCSRRGISWRGAGELGLYHLVSHLDQYIEFHAYVDSESGQPCTVDGKPVTWYPMFWIDPDNLLQCTPRPKRKKYRRESIPVYEVVRRQDRLFASINGIWFEFIPLPDENQEVVSIDMRAQMSHLAFYGIPLYPSLKRQCGKQDLKKFGLQSAES